MSNIQELWLGDCLDLMKKIPDKSIDIVISDPPYGINYLDWDILHNNTNSALGGSSPKQNNSSFKRRNKPINGWNNEDKNIGLEYQKWCEIWLLELFRITKECSPILLFNSRRFYHRLCCAAENSGFLIKDMLIWKKDRAIGKAQHIIKVPKIIKFFNLNKNEIRNYRIGNLKPIFEPIAYIIKPYKNTVTDCFLKDRLGGFFSFGTDVKDNIFYYNIETELHPTQKPLKLLEDLIKTFSFENQIILDPFMGSGTTCLAAKNLNRQYIGIDKEDKYYNIARKRIFNE